MFCDLDGVLLDVSERYFRVHCDIVGAIGAARLDKAAYWRLKREAAPLAEVLRRSGCAASDVAPYRRQWRERIETAAYLRTDVVIAGAVEALRALMPRHPLVLVTLRQRADGLQRQLKALALTALFAEVLVAPPPPTAAWRTKKMLIRASRVFAWNAVVVGDTEVDIRAGKALGVTTVGVLSGIRSRARLAAEAPDHLLASLETLGAVMEERPRR